MGGTSFRFSLIGRIVVVLAAAAGGLVACVPVLETKAVLEETVSARADAPALSPSQMPAATPQSLVAGYPSGAPLVAAPPPKTAVESVPLNAAPSSLRPGFDPAAGAYPRPFVGGTDTSPDSNLIRRFQVLRQLFNDGLMTEEEYGSRRNRNIAALLPLSSAEPPALGLERPVPPASQISARLQALRAALEMRAITAGEHAAERTMILDGILPSSPSVRAPPQAPPADALQAGAMAGRLERLKAMGMISPEDVVRERGLIEKAMRGDELAIAAAKASALVPPAKSGKDKDAGKKGKKGKAGKGAAEATSVGGVFIHLASHKSQAEADAGWKTIAAKHPDVLGGLSPEISPINMGSDMGTYYRVKVGPLKNRSAAQDLCQKLAAEQQYCRTEPAGK
ncbi:MAG: SPOR domain-containing protein [Alphaproteobacteria bacterium]